MKYLIEVNMWPVGNIHKPAICGDRPTALTIKALLKDTHTEELIFCDGDLQACSKHTPPAGRPFFRLIMGSVVQVFDLGQVFHSDGYILHLALYSPKRARNRPCRKGRKTTTS